MLLRLAIALGVVLALGGMAALWRRPPSRLRRLDLAELGIRGPAVVQFSAAYCAPCKAAVPRLERAASAAGVRYAQVDVGDEPELARRYGIRRVPTIAVTGRGGRVVDVWTSVPEDDVLTGSARRARTAPPALRAVRRVARRGF